MYTVILKPGRRRVMPSIGLRAMGARKTGAGVLLGLLLLMGLSASAVAYGTDMSVVLGDLQRWLVVSLPLNQVPWALAVIMGLSVAGGVLGLPVTLMIALCAMLFGAVPGMVYSMAGCLAGAMLAYAAGCYLDPDEKLIAGRGVRQVRQRLEQGGLFAVILLRLFPLLPFTFVNLAAGAIRMRWRDYVVGTALGMLPGIVVLSVLMGRVHPAHAEFASPHFDAAVASLAGIVFVAWIVPLLLRRFADRDTPLFSTKPSVWR